MSRSRGEALAPVAQEPKRRMVFDLLSVLSRVVPAALFSLVCYGFWLNFRQTGKWTSLLWMLSEGVVVVLLVVRRESDTVSRSPWDWLAGVGGTLAPLLARPTSAAIIPDLVGSALQLAGAALEICAKVALGRSFGIVAADRGLVCAGPYRIVRHPIYLGYLVTHVGFLLANWGGRNAAVYLVVYVFQVARIFSEERLMGREDSYRDYRARVRYRLIPGIF